MENNNSSAGKVTLKGDACIDLWLQGKDVWNQWVKEHPIADVSFAGVKFDELKKQHSLKSIDFFGYHFPKGNVSFKRAKFGEGYVTFYKAEFGEGDVYFTRAEFGKGDVYFTRAEFGKGDVSFLGAEFGKGDVDFTRAEFGKGDVSFSGAEFGKGNVDFIGAKFGKGNVSFLGAEFGEGNVRFYDAEFGEGDVSFLGAEFGEGNVRFYDAEFGEGNVDFIGAKFGGHADFSYLTKPETINRFSFNKATFTKTIDISHNKFSCVVDFTNTAINHQLTLDDMTCDWEKENIPKYYLNWVKAKHAEDIPRLRRLKEIAEDNKDHELALEFNAQEMKAKRWHKNKGLLYALSDWVYRVFSNYGRSIVIPLVALIGIWLCFSCVYFAMSSHVKPGADEKLYDSLAFSAAQILPFVPSSRLSTQKGIEVLFANDFSSGVYCTAIFQGIVSFGLLFLLGLALRNRFRL